MKVIHPVIAHIAGGDDVFVRLRSEEDGGGIEIYNEEGESLAEGEQFEIVHGSISYVSKGDVVWSAELITPSED